MPNAIASGRRRGMLAAIVATAVIALAGCGRDGAAPTVEDVAVMRGVGFDLRPFDASTGRAGALQIDGVQPPFEEGIENDPKAVAHNDRIRYLFLPFGWGGESGRDPQWNFVLPLGTPVTSLVDGLVCEVPRLYSGDFSVRVAARGTDCGDGVYFETEHVEDPLVQPGDEVRAGQRVASVSSYQQDWSRLGYGIVEIGVAFPSGKNGPPIHVCPTLLFDPSVRDQLTADLRTVMDAWSSESGDAGLYVAADVPAPGCFVDQVEE
ncbi:MAG: hypothetical protein KJS90_09515 [Acidobacteria bacterium]|nr:hypothetical protein [Acidobacteriota bacterium]